MKPKKFNNLKHFSWAFIALLVTLAGCKRDSLNGDTKTENTPVGPVNIAAKDLVVPANFNLETEKDLTVRVGVQNAANPTERSVIKVYANVPSTGELMTTGITDAKGEFTATLRVPAMQEFIYIERTGEDGSSEYQKVAVRQFVTALFNGGQTTPFIFRKTGSGMNCSSGCTRTVNNLSSNEIVNNNETVCFTGTLNGSITIRGGGKIKICGSGNVTGLTMDGNAQAYILENTILTFSNVNTNGSQTVFKNYSDSFKTTGALALNGLIENHGRMYVNGDLDINSNGEFKNYDIINITGNFNVNKKFFNYHYVTVNGTMNNNSNADFENSCFLWVKQNLNNNGDMINLSFIKVGETYTQNSSGKTELDDAAALFTKNMMLNKDIEGTGTNRSKVKVSATTTINSNGKVKGKIDYCDSNGVETNNGQVQSPAALSCTGYIASSTCFPESFGAPTIVDTDGDGVANSQDEYPNDAARAFNSYYPSATSCATLAYEDLWPTTGDYDFNDLVLAFNIHKVLNADNKVVDYKVKMKVRAIGAAFNNGFGFQLDELVPGDIQTITGQLLTKNIITRNANNTEAGQTKAVVVCFDSPEPSMQRAAGSMFNTIKANGVGTSDTIRINLSFTSPVVDSKLAIGKFNPFIFTNQRRGYEVHLGNFTPTSLANTGLFGTFNDRTNSGTGTYYKNANGMPWAILLPVDFAYPVEYAPITSAYNTFDDWAASGGSTNTDWYTNNPGNRNSGSIY